VVVVLISKFVNALCDLDTVAFHAQTCGCKLLIATLSTALSIAFLVDGLVGLHAAILVEVERPLVHEPSMSRRTMEVKSVREQSLKSWIAM
jgi:hypothetical protein